MTIKRINFLLVCLLLKILAATLLVDIVIKPCESCTRTQTVPETTASGTFTPASTTESTLSPSITPTVILTTTTQSTTTTTTTAAYCPSAAPLFYIPNPDLGPGHTVVQFEPAVAAIDPTPNGDSIKADCINRDPTKFNSQVTLVFDSDRLQLETQDINNISPSSRDEQITLTCTPSGNWEVSIITIDLDTFQVVPKSGIITSPEAIACIAG